MQDKNKHKDIDALLGDIFRSVSLREMFDKRLHELGLTERDVRRLLKMEYRTLHGIIDGTQKRGDISSFKKLAAFLNMPLDDFLDIHSSLVEKQTAGKSTITTKKKFIKDNFDLAVLRKSGFINSITDIDEIEKRITSFFGLSSLFEYNKRSFYAAFWATSTMVEKRVDDKRATKTSVTRDFWLTTGKSIAAKIDNPNHYDRAAIIKFFPEIRWFTMSEEFGLINVIKQLFKLGVTVVFLPRLSALKLRGATFSVNNKPVIILTDHKGFYPTLWHCLIHELYHVLFDLGIISKDEFSYHVSDDTDESFIIDEKEIEADEFARKYLFSKEKMESVIDYIYDNKFISEAAKSNNVHPSIIYIYHAYDTSKDDRLVWIRAKRFMPDINIAVHRLSFSWGNIESIEDHVKKLKLEIYN